MDAKLVMFRPNGERKEFPLTKPLTVIGRGENCDLRVPLDNVSRRHCELTLGEDELKVKDLASSNGTYVNNKRVNEAPLSAGDRLVIGPVVLTVQIDGVPEEITPVKTRAEQAGAAAADGTAAGDQEAGEDIVELQSDDGGTEQTEEDIFAAVAGGEDEGEDVDPIAALEALAAEGGKKKEDEES